MAEVAHHRRVMQRIVVPEMIDELPPDDPEAVASRRDLRWINAMMGNTRWIERQVSMLPLACRRGIVEPGAGDGRLSRKMSGFGEVTAVELVPRPPDLDRRVRWLQGDLLEIGHGLAGGVMAANLFLHHFDEVGLARIGRIAERFDALAFVEPLRTEIVLWRASLLLPLVNRTTRHDMPASIRAGFVPGELPALLGLDRDCWDVSESTSYRGALRMLAVKRKGVGLC